MDCRALFVVLALLVIGALCGDVGMEDVTVFDVEADTGAFCVVPDLVPRVGAAYKAVLVFQFVDPVDVLKIQFPAPAGEELAAPKVFTQGDLEDLSQVVVVLHDFDGTNKNGWNNELFEEFQFLNGIVHSQPAIAQAAVHIMSYEPLVRPANHNCLLPSDNSEYISMKPASYFEQDSTISESSSESVAAWNMHYKCKWIVASLVVVFLLIIGVSIGYCGCTYLVSEAEESNDNPQPDDELVFDYHVPMNQPASLSGKQVPQYMPFRAVALGSPAVTYNVAVLV